ncbi:membrane dipeptidase [Rhizobium sp. AN80A]|uniref:dipeptidase n=1 Tax=Rhizobium sp. AN80A TaxID=3040673 RepID=UPI0024B38C73|nr:membrane dipeptidase [Rhizobium sp. AN80A]
MSDFDIDAAVADIFRRSVIWDGHSGFMPDPAADLTQLSRWRDAGVNYLSVDVCFDALEWQSAIATIAAFRRWIDLNADKFVLVSSVHDIHRAKAEGKMAITFDLEGANALDGRIEMVELYHRLGVRQILFAYNRNNQAGGGCHDEDVGLTSFGRQMVSEMNRLGIFVDVTHCAYRTSMEAMECSSQPVIFSHSNPRALLDHERNITDEQIRACAATGGLVGVVGLENFLGEDASPDTICNHICYLADLVGPQHVGISLDHSFPVDVPHAHAMFETFPQYWPLSQGYGRPNRQQAHPGDLAKICGILLKRGMSSRDVEAILGGNFMRLAAQVWR